MKKIAACDIERKIRLIGELPDRYKTLSPEEKIWVPGLLSVAEAEIKDLLKKDRKAHLPALKLHKSRDVSHLKDLKSAKSSPAFISLPTDINQLKNLKDFQSVTKIKSNPKICKKRLFTKGFFLIPRIPKYRITGLHRPRGSIRQKRCAKPFKLIFKHEKKVSAD